MEKYMVQIIKIIPVFKDLIKSALQGLITVL